MRSPSLKEYQQGKTTWKSSHKNMRLEVAHWGHGTMNEGHGMWNSYIYYDEQMFLPEEFSKLVMPETVKSGCKSYDYSDFPDDGFHCGITFYDINTYWDRMLEKEFRVIKVGCDYGHLYDMENGYNYCLDEVKSEAQLCIDQFLQGRPNVNERCSYSGRWDKPENFYVSKNGPVHNDYAVSVAHDNWKPIREPANEA